MKTTTITTYDNDDIRALDDMSTDDVIETLERIGRGWLPQDMVFALDGNEFKEFTEEEYQATKMQKAISTAKSLIKNAQEPIKGKEIIVKRCADCEDYTNRCPLCRQSLDDDYSSEPNYCPNCGQKLIWTAQNETPLRR